MLSASGIVRVSVTLSPEAAGVRDFGVLMIAGDSNVISPAERFRTYTSISGVGADFGVDDPEYQAAALYFGQTPKPGTLMIGRWLRTASAGENIGGILTESEQALANWTAISAGGFNISIDGVAKNLTGLDFSGVTNLNGVASIITAALGGDAVCTWNGSYFVITSDTTGDGSKASGTITFDSNPSYGAQAQGTIELTGNPANGNTVTIKGTTVTFVSGTPTGNQVEIGADATATAAALQAFLQASADVNLSLMTYNTIGTITTITAKVFGTAGNAYGLSKVGANITVSGSGTLAGGTAPDTLTLNGVALTFVNDESSVEDNEVLVGPTKEATAANLQLFLNETEDADLLEADYSTAANVLSIEYATAGTSGNSYTLAETGSSMTRSAATLLGGTVPSSVGYATTGGGTDISGMLKLTAADSQSLVAGADAETPAECVVALEDASTNWYGIMFAASVQPTDDQNMDVAEVVEAFELKRMFGVTISNTDVLSALVTDDLASRLKDAGYKQSFCQYTSSGENAIASFFGRGFTVDFTANNSTINLMFKQEPGVTAEDLSQTQAATLKAKRCNVFVEYDNDTTILQYGVMSGSAYWDEIHGADWLQNALQVANFNVLYLTPKVPQTDSGMGLLTNASDGVLSQGVANGFLAPGVWTGPSFGQLKTGDYLKNGYYIYTPPMSSQSQSDRDDRKAVVQQIAAKLAGAINSADILVSLNR